jgi:hypothetical protein
MAEISTNNHSTQISSEPLTTKLTEEYASGLLRNAIDERIVKIRPMSTPIDQISRCAGARAVGSMTVEYYSVDTKKTETTLNRKLTCAGSTNYNGVIAYAIDTNDNAIFDVSETILLPAGKGYDSAGNEMSGLVFYIYSKSDKGIPMGIPVNCKTDDGGNAIFGDVAKDTKVIRMGRAATELDVQTAQFAVLPRKSTNNCQIFKMQVEQSTMQKIADKEVGWSFNDQEEAAIIDMRLGMEKSYLFGSKAKIYDITKKEDVYLTGGIWNQTSNECAISIDEIDDKALVELCSKAFTGTGGSKRKILLAGTKLMEALSNANYNKTVSAGETFVKWGIKFREIQSNFGTLYVLHSEIFDQCGHTDDGFIIDPEYITKYCHIPFNIETLDLRRSGVRNTDAVVITEASCLVLRFPDAHLRVIGVSNNVKDNTATSDSEAANKE